MVCRIITLYPKFLSFSFNVLYFKKSQQNRISINIPEISLSSKLLSNINALFFLRFVSLRCIIIKNKQISIGFKMLESHGAGASMDE